MATALLERKPAKTAAKSTIAFPQEREKVNPRKSESYAWKARLQHQHQEKEEAEEEKVVGLPLTKEHMYCGKVNLKFLHV